MYTKLILTTLTQRQQQLRINNEVTDTNSISPTIIEEVSGEHRTGGGVQNRVLVHVGKSAGGRVARLRVNQEVVQLELLVKTKLLLRWIEQKA